MTKRILTAAIVALTASFATTAEARVERGYDGPRYQGSITKTHASRKQAGRSQRHASSRRGSAKRHASRSHGHGHSGGGTSRSCLTAAARSLLGRIESQFGPVSVVSTCRPGAVIATSGKPSKHRHGQAIDFDAGSRKGAIVKWLVANHHSGGTMTYRDMSHIHVDVGYRFVKLGANSGRG